MRIKDSKIIKQLQVSLLYLKMMELRDICIQLKLPKNGKKLALIERILKYLETGNIQTLPEIPSISKAKSDCKYPLSPETLILKGAYKNDLKTRLFLKNLVGPHFHFTAYGIDWIEECWLSGKPPTYKEFASYWEQERLRRVKEKDAPKKEWAYINFTQGYLRQNPIASKTKILAEWEKERKKHAALINEILKKDVSL